MARPIAPGSVKLASKTLSDGRQSLYLVIYQSGVRKYEFLRLYLTGDRAVDSETQRIAEATRARRELAIKAGHYDVRLEQAGDTDLIAFMEEEKVRRCKTWPTVIRNLRVMRPRGVKLRDVNDAFVTAFVRFLRDRELGPNTIVTYYNAISSACTLAVRRRLLEHNPFTGHDERPSKRETIIEYLSIEELRMLYRTPCEYPEVKRAFLTACYCGLRLSDMRRLVPETIEVRHASGAPADGTARQAQYYVKLRQKKTGNVIYHPLPVQAYSLICDGMIAPRLPFDLPADQTINVWLRSWAAVAGVRKHLHFHVSRHTYATNLLTEGADLYTVSKLIGHASIKETQRYAKVIDERKDNAVNALPGLEG